MAIKASGGSTSRTRRSRRASLSAIRSFYARFVTASAGVADERIVHAFAALPREDFLGPGPWQVEARGYISTGTDDPAVLYQNMLVGLAPERRINNGEPTLHARSIAMADPHAGDTVIHVGAGTGYYTAILAQLVGPAGKVQAYEIQPDIAARATSALKRFANVHVLAQSALDVPLPEAAVIYVSAGATHIPSAFLDALAVGGRLVLPLTPNERIGGMLLVRRESVAGFAARFFSPAAFIACSGARDDAHSSVLAAAFDTGGAHRVRSLRRDDAPDASAWCVGPSSWLSTEAPPSA
jgi:protein-L-isoaspartate(D-aspartate) O-methyltransferase